jgi:histidyl-tRNA synthetase
MEFQAPRGTADVLPNDQGYWRYVESIASQVAESFGYRRIDTPVFEDTNLFIRGIGDLTDIVEKETYTFKDRGGDSLTLRPEGTASVCRAYLQHGMHNMPQPVRLFYLCPNFRYERPQAGRFRAFHQFGIEAFGESDPYIDAEVIEVSWRFLKTVGIDDISLSINSIGDMECRPKYVDALKTHYQNHLSSLCPDCHRRLDTNPLRLLDCKIESCQPVIESAPKGTEYLCIQCNTHWLQLQEYLTEVGIGFDVDNTLVRGLDYYSRTVYEITPPTDGRTNVIAGGGRYDGLLEQLGGPATPGIGFGMGIERVIENIKRLGIIIAADSKLNIMFAYMGELAKKESIRLSSEIRQLGGEAFVGPSRGLRSQMRYASNMNASHTIIIGEDELSSGSYTVRDLNSGDQSEMTADGILNFVKDYDNSHRVN